MHERSSLGSRVLGIVGGGGAEIGGRYLVRTRAWDWWEENEGMWTSDMTKGPPSAACPSGEIHMHPSIHFPRAWGGGVGAEGGQLQARD